MMTSRAGRLIQRGLETLRRMAVDFHNGPERTGFWITAGAALLVQLMFLAVLPESYRVNENSDYVNFYRPVAEAMQRGAPWLTPDGEPALRYPPGYPLILAAVFGAAESLPGDRDVWLILSNVFWAMIGAALHYGVARRMLSPLPALPASALWISYPPFLWLSKQPNSEMPFLAFIFAGIYCALRVFPRHGETPGGGGWKWALAAGALIGSATLIRPVTLALPLALAPVFLIAGWSALTGRSAPAMPKLSVRLAWALALIVGHLLVLAPWQVWAHQQAGQWIPVSTGGRLSLLDGLTLTAKPDRQGPDVPADVRRLMQDIQDNRRRIRGPADALQLMVERAEPATLAKMLWVEASRSWYATESLRFEKWLRLLQLPYLALILWGIWRWGRCPESRLWALLTVTITLYFWAMTTLVLSVLRYMVPAMALLMIPLAFPWSRLLHRALTPDATSRDA